MNIDKVIEIKGRTGEEFLNTNPDEIEEADRLSIEAMKRHKEMSALMSAMPYHLLPGETKD